MTARPNENDPVDLDPAREPAYEIEELSKTGSELPPKAITPKVEVVTPKSSDDADKSSKPQTNAEAGIPPGSVEQSEQGRANQGDIEREIPDKGGRRNESVEGGDRDENVEREDDQRGAA